jgi:two-component system sensor histidine kinase FlrB
MDLAKEAEVRVNRSQLELAIQMIIQNAIEAMSSAGGQLGLHVRRRRDGIVMHVADSGPGMDSATKKQCLLPFFTTKGTGNGLGLPITLGIVRRHGGRLRVSSMPGKGSIFSIWFPVEPEVTRG